MRILALDTTTQSGSVAALEADEEGARVVGLAGTKSDEPYSSRLFRQLEFLLAELKLRTADFDLFAVAAGPGSFTGLRVGLTAVKGWSEVHRRPIAAVSTLEAAAHCAASAVDGSATREKRRIISIADARRGQVYGGIYKTGADGVHRSGDDVVMTPGEFWSYLQKSAVDQDAVFATTAPIFVKSIVAVSPFASCKVVGVSPLLASAVGEVGWQKCQRGETCDALTLDAHYVRRSDAEVQFKG